MALLAMALADLGRVTKADALTLRCKPERAVNIFSRPHSLSQLPRHRGKTRQFATPA
jgi:hypothetical protein